MVSSDPMKVIGVSYQAAGSTEVTLLSAPGVRVKLFDGAQLTGILFRDKEDAEEQCLNGLNVTGIVYREEERSKESILKADNVAGAYEKNGFQKAERVFLYLLPIVGVLGLVVPLVLNQSNLTSVSAYLAVPLIIVPIAYLLYLRFHRRERGI